jgi:tRNA(Arg) A34 adenosine deaminase TadA
MRYKNTPLQQQRNVQILMAYYSAHPFSQQHSCRHFTLKRNHGIAFICYRMIMEQGKAFMDEAVRLALGGMERGEGGPFGAVIVKNGAIVGRGWNQTFKYTDPSAHAEVQAIRDACRNMDTLELAGCTIYSSGEPCPMCMAAIYWTMIDGVIFANTKEEAAATGFDDAKIYKELALPWQARSLSMVHYPNESARQAFEHWKAKMSSNI